MNSTATFDQVTHKFHFSATFFIKNGSHSTIHTFKNYLMKPPILVPPVPKRPLLLYLTTMDIAMGALLAQYLEETRKENAIYYINKKMLPYEEKYSPLKKTCVALVWATRKLTHYMLAYKVLLIARMDPLKYLMEKPVQDGKTAKWVLLLSEFDIKYVT